MGLLSFFSSSLSLGLYQIYLSSQKTIFGLVDSHYFMLIFYFIGFCYIHNIGLLLLSLALLCYTQPLDTLKEKWSQISGFAFGPENSLLSCSVSVPSNGCFQVLKVFNFSIVLREHWYKLSNPLLPKQEVPNYLFMTFFFGQWVTLWLFSWKTSQWLVDRIEFYN